MLSATSLPLAVSFAGFDPTYVVIWMIAWFAQMGFHEGGHAWTAWWLGDDTSYVLGKRTINPLRHVNWDQPMSIFNSAVLPLLTTIAIGFPMGMAYVPVGVHNFRNPARDHALVAFAGPAGGFIVALVAFLIWFGIYPTLPFDGIDIFTMLFTRQAPEGMAAANKGQVLLCLLLAAIYFTAILYSIFNLVPIPPLDGSRILYYFGNWRLREFLEKIESFGFFIIILLFWILPGGYLLVPVERALFRLYESLPAVVWGAK